MYDEPRDQYGQRHEPPRGAWAEVARIATRQEGVVGLAQLLRCGLTDDQVAYAAKIGRLTRLGRGVYLLGGTIPSPLGRIWAAGLGAGDGAAASHHTAATLLGLEPPSHDQIHLVVPKQRREPPGTKLHLATTLETGDLWRRRGLPVTSPPRTLLDEATLIDDDRLAVMLSIALAKRLLTLDKLDSLLSRSNGHRGTGRLARVLAQERDDPGEGRTHAEMEAMFLPMLRAIPGLPRYLRNHELRLAEGFVVRPDIWFPERRAWVELDSRTWHEQRRTMDADRRKDQRAVALGCLPFRMTWRHLVREWIPVRADLCRVLRIA